MPAVVIRQRKTFRRKDGQFIYFEVSGKLKYLSNVARERECYSCVIRLVVFINLAFILESNRIHPQTYKRHSFARNICFWTKYKYTLWYIWNRICSCWNRTISQVTSAKAWARLYPNFTVNKSKKSQIWNCIAGLSFWCMNNFFLCYDWPFIIFCRTTPGLLSTTRVRWKDRPSLVQWPRSVLTSGRGSPATPAPLLEFRHKYRSPP